MTRLILIAAVARNGVIGDAGQLLWRLPEDMRYLRAQTMGCPVIMGRKTWDSLPARFRPLPGRHNIVVTRQASWQADGATPTPGLAEAVAAAGAAERVFVIGGAQLYAAALPLADELLLTELDASFDGDTHFPAWDHAGYDEVSREHHGAEATRAFGFDFVRYMRRR
jgi:dihydrofolate reductase